MTKEYDVAVVGATGAVGETMMAILEQRDFPVRNLYPLASERSAGKKVQFKGKNYTMTMIFLWSCRKLILMRLPDIRNVALLRIQIVPRFKCWWL